MGDNICCTEPLGAEEEMVQVFKEIPAEQRWDMATRCADIMPFAFSQAFRNIAPEKQEEIDQAEMQIWQEMGKKQVDIAKKFGLPTNSASEVAKTFSEVSRIVLGPRMNGRIINARGNSATIITEECPMATNSKRYQVNARLTCEHCNAYSKAAVESLNPDYHLTSDRHMCMGDSSCQMTIEKIQR